MSIKDINGNRNKIIITYFDEGVYGNVGPNADGLAVFDFERRQNICINSNAG